ncbi:MAG: hypothetical protein ABJP02_16645 [Parasphingorhabdus sp.]
MRDLAKKVGISDVRLRKLLKSKGVLTPPQGHWNRLKAGRPVPECPPSPPRQAGEHGRIQLDARFRDLIQETPPLPVGGPFVSDAVHEDLSELREAELKAIGRAKPALRLTLPNVGLARLLKREEQIREKAKTDRWYWREPTFDTPLAQRQLRILNGLFFVLERRNHSGIASENQGKLSAGCTVGDMYLGLEFSVIGEHRTEFIDGYARPARDLPASTPLRLSLTNKFPQTITATWSDNSDSKLESKLAGIAADIIVAGEAAFRQSLIEAVEWEERHRRWQEDISKQQKAAALAQRLEDLKTSGTLLARAEEIRTLVENVRVAVLGGLCDVTSDELNDWENWALEYADSLDPVLSGQVLTHIREPDPK